MTVTEPPSKTLYHYNNFDLTALKDETFYQFKCFVIICFSMAALAQKVKPSKTRWFICVNVSLNMVWPNLKAEVWKHCAHFLSPLDLSNVSIW